MIIPTLDRSGAEKQFALLASRLPEEEFDVRAIALTRSGPYAEMLSNSNIPLTVLGKRFKCDPFSFWRLRAELKKHDPDIVHTWLFAANSYGRLCAGAAPKARVVVSERCVDSWKAGWQIWLDRKLIGRTDRLVGNSQSVVEFYRELGVPSEKLACIPNGIEVPEGSVNVDENHGSHESLSRRNEILNDLSLPQDCFVAGYVGRLAKQKRVEDLIWAVETLRQIRPTLKLVIVGEGPERHRLESFAREIHCSEHIRFLGHRDDVSRVLPAFSVFCLASTFEGMSNSVMEAMAAGLPVIASDIPANRELVIQNETGFLFKALDTVGIMQFLRRMIDEPSLAKSMGIAGRSRIMTEFSVERMVDSYATLYRQLRRP